MTSDINRTAVKEYLTTLQNTLCQRVEALESSLQFKEDAWNYPAGGGGRSRILRKGDVFEQAGINFSHVTADSLPTAATNTRSDLKDAPFEAMGVSLVFHPQNPFVPTTHFNLRFFIAEPPQKKPVWWFGGGYDLTPYYGFKEDCQHWHHTAREACLPFGESVYPRFKKWCDDYFYLKHRKEPRGIGGLFFDDLNKGGFEDSFNFINRIGDSFSKAYFPIVEKRKEIPYNKKHREFQLYRRGRYVEFNLLYDRGTLFGLQSGGRTESILMSLPPEVSWRYNWQPAPNSEEATLYEKFLFPQEWI